MKKILTYLSILTAALLFTPNSAEARNHGYTTTSYASGHTACGCPIITKKVYVGNDRYGRPIYKYYRQASSCRCSKSTNRSYRAHKPINKYSKHSRYTTNTKYRPTTRYNGKTQLRLTCRR